MSVRKTCPRVPWWIPAAPTALTLQGLAGVGVALKLAMAVAGPERAERIFLEYADLAAIGTVADVMPMTGENRTIVQTGLSALAHPRRLGLARLIQEAGLGTGLTSVSVGYTLAPRINAAGRMGKAGLAAELLPHPGPGPGIGVGPGAV